MSEPVSPLPPPVVPKWPQASASHNPDRDELTPADHLSGRRFRASYTSLLGEAPTLGPSDRTGALQFADKLSRVIRKGGWSRSERNRLYRLRRIWRRRASGLDIRFNIVGNRRGHVHQKEQEQIDRLRALYTDLLATEDRP